MENISASLVLLAKNILASILALLTIIGGYKGMVAMYNAWQQRRKPQAEIGVMGAQEAKAYAEAAQIKTNAEISMIGVAMGMAKEIRDENIEMRDRINELEKQDEECRRELARIKAQLK
jgi:hypothetical protein